MESEVNFILRPDRLEMKVRISIFILVCLCAGLPALVWSVSDVIHHRKNGHRISVFIILLLLTDFAELLLSPYILLKLFLDEISWHTNWTCWYFWAVLWPSRVCGLLLNQLVAVEGILYVKYPLYLSNIFSSPCFTILYILVFFAIFIGHIFLHCIPFCSTPIVLLVLIVSVFTLIISCGIACASDCHSHEPRKPNGHILVVFIFTLLVLYLPYILTYLHVFPWLNLYFLMNVRLIIDPLLCLLVCKQNFNIQTSQTPEGISSV